MGFTIENGVLQKYTGQDTTVIIPDGVAEIGPWSFCEQPVIEVIIADTTVEIGESAFLNCNKLQRIKCKTDSIRKIGKSAFNGCECLTTAEFVPNSIEEIGERAFGECRALADDKGFVIVQNVLYDYFGDGGDIVVPDGVIALDSYCFMKCNVYQRGHVDLETICLPKSLKTIGNAAFENCRYLESITIPDEVTEIGDYAFRECKHLKEVILPKKLTRVGKCAFDFCAIAELKLPKSLAIIEEGAFMNNRIKKLNLPDNIECISNKAFAGQSELLAIYVKKGSKSEKAAIKYTKKSKDKLVIR